MLLPTQAASLRAGITAATEGQAAGTGGLASSRSVPNQKRPRAHRRYTHTTNAEIAMTVSSMRLQDYIPHPSMPLQAAFAASGPNSNIRIPLRHPLLRVLESKDH